MNFALFGEHIFYITPKWSLTPGIRYEYIRTESEGTYRRIDFDLTGMNPIRDEEFTDNRVFDRKKVLLGIGSSYKPNNRVELYANISQNYRSVTFNDIRVVNPSFQVDPNITDESGLTWDVGLRGKWKNISYDVNVFGLLYDDRLGEVLRAETRVNAEGNEVETGRVIRFRGNIGTALMSGIESLIDWNILRPNQEEKRYYKLNLFTNLAVTHSEYLNSEIPGVEGKQVEFIPTINLKSGIAFGYKNLLGNLQLTYLSNQFTDATNAPQSRNDNQSGIIGAIPSYHILDLSLAYRWNKISLESGINNLANNSYFTRRATGYPGPGIIPSAPRVWYITLQLKL